MGRAAKREPTFETPKSAHNGWRRGWVLWQILGDAWQDPRDPFDVDHGLDYCRRCYRIRRRGGRFGARDRQAALHSLGLPLRVLDTILKTDVKLMLLKGAPAVSTVSLRISYYFTALSTERNANLRRILRGVGRWKGATTL
ncbi:hypothetical protein EYR36_002359 [Pleurotus pulmonarius]|nr:hypothetical protein EYR36_002359 [Pleurotus pulmonarius]